MDLPGRQRRTPSVWPAGFALGVVSLLAGLVVSWWAVAAGAALAAVFGALWLLDLRVRPKAAVEEVPPPSEAEPVPVYGRSVFLARATLGLGAVVGALAALPAIGFAVLPAFARRRVAQVDLGPLDRFPEGEYVVVTFLADPAQGEVSRRTAFVRSNGLVGIGGRQVPSFTILSSRCTHVGCPTEPGGLLDPAAARTFRTPSGPVRLVPTRGVSGFGCPCHGSQFDTEGNRTAGPAPRPLDRYAFSVVDGRLVLGRLISVGRVEGAGSTARFRAFPSRSAGEATSGLERWLYPLQPPR